MSTAEDQAIVREANELRKAGALRLRPLPGDLAYAVFFTNMDGKLAIHSFHRTRGEADAACGEVVCLMFPRHEGPVYVGVAQVPEEKDES